MYRFEDDRVSSAESNSVAAQSPTGFQSPEPEEIEYTLYDQESQVPEDWQFRTEVIRNEILSAMGSDIRQLEIGLAEIKYRQRCLIEELALPIL